MNVAISLIIWAVLWSAIHFISPKLISKEYPWILIVSYVATYLLISFVRNRAKKDKVSNTYKSWPTSGPVGKFGQSGLKLVFYASGVLSLLNPFLLLGTAKQGLGNIYLKIKSNEITEPHQFQQQSEFNLPFEYGKKWLVYNGVTKKKSLIHGK